VGESQKKTSQIIEAARGKVLVIDEAYALDDNLYGAQVLDTLVERVQGTPADDIAVLLLGYEEDMQKMLKNQNPGLLRRFNPDYAFVFDDFNDHELLNILEANLKSYETKASIEFMEKALDVLQNQRLQTNFGNAGAVDLLVKGAVQKAAKRFGERPEEAILQECDIPDASCGPQSEDPLSDLDKLYKMETVKEKLDGMRKRLEVARREGDEAKISLHFVFRGSPGTGKTTVARALANILFGLKLKPTPKIVETTGLDLMANYVGQTATKTTEKLKESKGGILFIDEAYNLGVGTYAKEALDTLLAAMTSPDYEDVSIVIAGYPDELNQMMTTNPGMKSRFTEFIDFEDWDVEDCASFFKLCSSQKNFELESGVVEAVRQGCSTIRSLNGWGNGRDVRQLFTESKGLRDKRVYDTPNVEKTLALADVQAAIQGMIQARIPGALFGQDSEDPLSELDKLYKMEKVKDKLDGMRKKLEVAQREGDDSTKVSLHFVFRGAPGTGKTTVARAIAKVLFGLKLKPSPKIVETTGLDLMADYVGQTSTKTTAKLKESKGGVLFIDEAYNLGGGTYGKEALDTLLAAMTSPNYEDVCIVIAGYPVELDEMMSSNPGLKSRFTDFIEFEDWDADDCVSFIDFLAEKKKFELSSGVKELIHAGCSKLRNLPGWANGRDVAKLWTDMQGFRAQRVYEDTEAEPAKTLTSSDVKLAVEAMLNARTVPLGRKRSLNDITPPISPLASINHYYAQRGQGASESQHRQDQKHQPPSAAIQPLEQSATSAPQQQEGGSTPTRAQEEVAPGMDTCQTQAVEELREFQEMTCEYDDSDTTGAGGKHNGGDDILFVGRDEGVADEDWEELETAKEQERLRIDELRRQREENDRLLEEAKKAEEEARRMYEEELERVQKQMEREERERARREAWEKEERRRLAAEEKQRRLEAEARRLQEEERKQQEMQRRLQQIRLCPAGFNWFKSGCGWRCGGGSHYVSDSELRQQFGVDL
jgi:SpoVK/Ycf46/Vps4 family AAA+-type ATPase